MRHVGTGSVHHNKAIRAAGADSCSKERQTAFPLSWEVASEVRSLLPVSAGVLQVGSLSRCLPHLWQFGHEEKYHRWPCFIDNHHLFQVHLCASISDILGFGNSRWDRYCAVIKKKNKRCLSHIVLQNSICSMVQHVGSDIS